jgi:8-oxo-dGTP diphosphatase
MVKRAIEPFKNTWMFPAGFIEFGEHPEDTAKRELKEETGLIPEKLRFLEVGQSEDDPRALGHFIFLYEAEAGGKIKNSDKKENNEIGWVSIKNPPKIGWKFHRQIMRKLQLGEL